MEALRFREKDTVKRRDRLAVTPPEGATRPRLACGTSGSRSARSCSGKKTSSLLLVMIAGLLVLSPRTVRAQESSLKVAFIRPAEGETFYASPTSPFASTPVTGRVDGSDFDVRQVQVRLELFQGSTEHGSLTTTPQSDGTFSFDVAINPERPATKSSGEYACQGNCHAITPLGMPSGTVVLRLTATDPLGRTATAERSIVSDHSGYAHVPVQIVSAENPKQTIGGLTVVADTRLYEWRARQYSIRADAQGNAVLHIEALAQAPTRYLLHIQPTVLDGVLYQSPGPVEITLPAGATKAEPVMLIAASRRGQIEGALTRPAGLTVSDLTVRAIETSRGTVHEARTASGKFTLQDLPIGEYRLTVDDEEAAAQGIQVAPQTVDVSARPMTPVTMTVIPASPRVVRGVVRDGTGTPLPFAWLSTEDRQKSDRVVPSSGAFAVYGLPAETRSLWVTAPGYWSRPIALTGDGLEVTLTPHSDLRVIPLGSGAITLPPPTIATLSGNRLSLRRGWLWGNGVSSFVVNTPDLDVEVQGATFALECFPGEPSWLYMIDGRAQVKLSAREETIDVGAGQMLAFGPDAPRPAAVALEDAAVRTLHRGEKIPVRIESDPALLARLRDEVERWGIPSVQGAVIGAVLVLVLAAVGGWRQMRRRAEKSRRAATT